MGLIPLLSVAPDGQSARLTLGGNATSSTNADDLTSLQLSFYDPALAAFTVAQVVNATSVNTGLGIDFFSAGAPSYVLAVAGNGYAELLWDSVSGISDYTVIFGTDSITTTPQSVIGDTTAIIGSLTNNTLYFFAVVSQGGDTSYFRPAVPVVEAGRALSTAASGYLITDPINLNSTDFTIEFWIKARASGNIILSQGGLPATTNNFLDLGLENFGAGNKPYLEFWNNRIQCPFDVDLNRWYHLAFTADRASGRRILYINGDSVTSSVSGIYTGSGPLYIFTESETFGGTFNGTLDELRIWDHVRSPAQLRADMDRPVPATASGLLGLWHLNEPVGNGQSFDASRARKHGVWQATVNPVLSTALAPFRPDTLKAASGDGELLLSWDSTRSLDLAEYQIVVSTNADPEQPRHRFDQQRRAIRHHADGNRSGQRHPVLHRCVWRRPGRPGRRHHCGSGHTHSRAL
ncbi:MAG: LamG domain-containing protein [Cytophagales bacterium]|nr:LamG domain-containing protein [Cytophagales bacterium]